MTMEARPGGVSDAIVTEALRDGWGFDAATLDYAPLGFGSYHWRVADAGGARRFVTVDDLGTASTSPAAAFDALERAFTTARALQDSGLEFVAAPLRSTGGDVVRRLSDRYSLAVFPVVDGQSGAFDDVMDEGDRAELIDRLAMLHRATPGVRSITPELRVRPITVAMLEIEAALTQLSQPWTSGPFGVPARSWLRDRRPALRGWIEHTRHVVDGIDITPDELVVTHGEPHPGNVMRSDTGLLLIDWDTVGLARPERDLWFFADDTGALDRYRARTGRAPDASALSLYRDAWRLADLAVFLRLFRGPHDENEDTMHAWAALEGMAVERW